MVSVTALAVPKIWVSLFYKANLHSQILCDIESVQIDGGKAYKAFIIYQMDYMFG